MLAKLADGHSRRATASSTNPSGTASAPSSFARRAEMLHPEPRSAAARSLLPRAARGVARGAARALRPRRRDRDRDAAAGSTSMRCSCGCIPAASRVAKLAKETPASFVAFDLARRRRRGSARRCRSASGARGSRRCWPASSRPIYLTPMTRDRERRRRLARAVRGRGARRRDREAGRRHLRAGQARDVQDQARAHGRLRGRGVPLAQERARHAGRLAAARPLRRRRARCITSA